MLSSNYKNLHKGMCANVKAASLQEALQTIPACERLIEGSNIGTNHLNSIFVVKHNHIHWCGTLPHKVSLPY